MTLLCLLFQCLPDIAYHRQLCTSLSVSTKVYHSYFTISSQMPPVKYFSPELHKMQAVKHFGDLIQSRSKQEVEEGLSLHKNMKIDMSLVDYLSYRFGCGVGDLHSILKNRSAKVKFIVEGISPEMESLQGWNDALCYLFRAQPAATCVEAKARLVNLLSR